MALTSTPFTINSRQINTGSNIFLDPQSNQPFQLPANLVQIDIILEAQSWNFQTPPNNVEYRVEYLDSDGQTWIPWGSVVTQEGARMLASKGGHIGAMTLYGDGTARQARINIIVDQNIRPGISASGTVSTQT